MAEVVHTKTVADGIQIYLADPYYGRVECDLNGVVYSQDYPVNKVEGGQQQVDLANSKAAGDPFIQFMGLAGQDRFVVDPAAHTIRFDDGTVYNL